MPERRSGRTTRALLIGLMALAAVISGCGDSGVESGDTMSDQQSADEAMTSDQGSPEGDLAFAEDDAVVGHGSDDAMTFDAMDDVDNPAMGDATVSDDGVLAAAIVILTDGDLEAALAAGWITDAEVGAAIEALQNGTIASYLD